MVFCPITYGFAIAGTKQALGSERKRMRKSKRKILTRVLPLIVPFGNLAWSRP
jgi:hypothetical protein